MLASHFYLGGGQYLRFCKMLLLETQVFYNFYVLPEDLNVWESFYIRQTETVSVNPVVGFCYNLEWVYNEILGGCAASSG